MEFFIGFVALSVLSFLFYKKYTSKKIKPPVISLEKLIIPDTGNLAKVVRRISQIEEYSEKSYSSGGLGAAHFTCYTLGDIKVIFQNGGFGSILYRVEFKNVRVPLGTNEMNVLATLVRQMLNEKKEQMEEQKQRQDNDILAAL